MKLTLYELEAWGRQITAGHMVVVVTTLKGGQVGEDDYDVNEEKLKMVEI